jgi:hypothetical protein
MTTEIGQSALEEVAVRKLARERGCVAGLVAVGISVPLGAAILGYLVPGAAILGFVVGPLFAIFPALIIAAIVHIRAVKRWKRASRAAGPNL